MNQSKTSKLSIHCILVAVLALWGSSYTSANTLFDDFGGDKGMQAVVDQFLWNLADDDRVSMFFRDTNLIRFREKLFEYFCVAAEGPCEYTGDTLNRAHANLKIDIADFNAVVEQLILAMETQHISTASQNQLLKRLAKDFNNVVDVPAATN